MVEKYYTDIQIADLMQISLSRLRAKICHGSPLPNRIELPESRTRLWKRDEVHDWLDKYSVSSDTSKASIRRVSKK